ncbi:MAG: hypothetical protein JJT76_09955 [Clostridiaceae bacterium]|nr:hypothetical protein [Clostridiaceae bacterium]
MVFSRYLATDGVWLASPAGWVIGLVLTLLYYQTGRWKKKIVVNRDLKE